MSWQKCPVCNGSGSVTNGLNHSRCQACIGHCVISELTGLPPSSAAKQRENECSEMERWIAHERKCLPGDLRMNMSNTPVRTAGPTSSIGPTGPIGQTGPVVPGSNRPSLSQEQQEAAKLFHQVANQRNTGYSKTLLHAEEVGAFILVSSEEELLHLTAQRVVRRKGIHAGSRWPSDSFRGPVMMDTPYLKKVSDYIKSLEKLLLQ